MFIWPLLSRPTNVKVCLPKSVVVKVTLPAVAPKVATGEIKYREDIRQGLETLPACFAEMLRGDNFGKMLVQVSPDPTQG